MHACMQIAMDEMIDVFVSTYKERYMHMVVACFLRHPIWHVAYSMRNYLRLKVVVELGVKDRTSNPTEECVD